MIFSDEITAHDYDQHFTGLDKDTWQIKERQGITARYCSYCGSLHPEDMYKLLNECDHAEFADCKYGYYHKMYIDIGKAMLKFYTKHLIDMKDKESIEKVLDRIKENTGVALISHLEK